MSAKTYNELERMLCDELDEIVSTGKITAGDLDAVHKLTDTIKNIHKIEAMDGGYSYDGNWNAGGNYGRNSYNDYHAYGNRGKHYVRGHYSYDGDKMMMDRLEEMIAEGDMSADDKRTLRNAMNLLRR